MIAVYPGSFDPVTYGHLDLIKRASELFDKVIVAVAHNKDKKPLFSVQNRVKMMNKAVCGFKNVEVDDFSTLTVDYVSGKNCGVIIRGIRMISDFEYEFQMALTNRKIHPEVETIFMMPAESYSYISSRLIKEAAFLGADVSAFVPDFVEKALKEKTGK